MAFVLEFISIPKHAKTLATQVKRKKKKKPGQAQLARLEGSVLLFNRVVWSDAVAVPSSYIIIQQQPDPAFIVHLLFSTMSLTVQAVNVALAVIAL